MGVKPHPVNRLFLRGLALVLPLTLTVALFLWLWNFLSGTIFQRVDAAVLWLVRKYVELSTDGALDPDTLRRNVAEAMPDGVRIWVSVALVIGIILLVGWWFSGFLGRRAVAAFERLLGKMPLIGAVYPHVRQITDFFFGETRKVRFESVVAIPYPRVGVYSLAFLTGSSLRSLNTACGKELISVFVPSSPMPATGYTLFVPKEELVPLKLSVEQALRAIVSGGVLLPSSELGGTQTPPILVEETDS